MKTDRKVTKAVIAAAGYGTRFLPATKNQPKEMLPIIDKPIIHYLVEEAVKSGIKDIILVTRAGLHIMEDYFDSHFELEKSLEQAGKLAYLEKIKEIPRMANFAYVRQTKDFPYGNGSPLLAAKNLIDDDEAVVYMFGDDVTLSKTPVVKQLIDVYEEYKPSVVVAAQKVPDEVVHKYGIVEYDKEAETPNQIKQMIEKPDLKDAPSNNATFGRYILSYDVVRKMGEIPTGKDDELWLADAVAALVQEGKSVIAQPIEGEWLTTGDPMNYIKTTLKFAQSREDLNGELADFIKEIAE